MRLFLVILLWLNPCVKVIADSIHDFHDVRGRESKSSNISLDQVVVRGAAIEHKDANHDGFYSINADDCGSTGWTPPPVTVNVTYSSEVDIAGFQFDAPGVIGASGGAAAEAGFTVSTGNGTVLGFSFSGAVIPAGSGILTTLEIQGDACLSNLVWTGADATSLDASFDGCYSILYGDPVTACDDESACNFGQDGACEYILDGECDCAGNVDLGCGCGEAGPSGCDNTCGSTLTNDDCGVCGGDNSTCLDCAGTPNGNAVEDECGTCDADSSNDCVQDCNGDWGGDAVADECGTCDADSSNDCVQDCAGVWGGTAENCPDWSVDLAAYDLDASVTSAVYFDDVNLGDSGDVLAAFVGNEVRGLADAVLLEEGDAPPMADIGTYVFFLTVAGNSNGESVTFKYYDASDDVVLDLSETLSFVGDGSFGNVVSPYVLTVLTEITQQISVVPGWNWISFNVEGESMAVNDVLSSLASAEGDKIKTLGPYADYYEGFGWFGSLEVLNPGTGYLLNSAEGGDMVYGSAAAMASGDVDYDLGLNRSIENDMWAFDNHRFEFNGSVTATISEETGFVVSEGDRFAAFVDGEIRGSVEAKQVPFGDNDYVFLLTVYGNADDYETMTFKYYNSETDEMIEFVENIEFISDMSSGNAIDPVVFSKVASDVVVGEYALNGAYPNPFNPSTRIEYSIVDAGHITVNVYDMAGRLVDEIVNGWHDAGAQSVVWNASDYPSGIYFVKLEAGAFSASQKIVLVK